MRPVYLAATGSELPPREKTADAVARGLIPEGVTEEMLSASGITAVCAAPDPTQAAPEMAVTALRRALDTAEIAAHDIGRLFHASSFDGAQMRVWSPAAYVQAAFGPTRAPALAVSATCGGGMAAFEVAALITGARGGTVAVTTADLWPHPLVNRWHTMPAFGLGDGAGAAVLTEKAADAVARVAACETVTDSRLEAGARTPAPFTPGDKRAIDFRERKDAFLETMPREEFDARRDNGLLTAVGAALTDARRIAHEIDIVIPSFLGRRMTKREYTQPLSQLGFSASQLEIVGEMGLTIGHAGSSDPFIALDLLWSEGHLTKGKSVLVLGVGGGYTWTAAVLDIIR